MSSPMSIGAIVQLSLRNLNRLSPARPSLLIGWDSPGYCARFKVADAVAKAINRLSGLNVGNGAVSGPDFSSG